MLYQGNGHNPPGDTFIAMLRLQLFACTLALALTLASGQRIAAQDVPACGQDLLTAQIRCHLDAANEAGSAEPCMAAENETVRFQCISLFAERSGTPEACRLISSDDPEGAILQNACIAGVAIATRDPAICEDVDQPDLADTCFTQLVLERGGDVSLCQRVQNPLLRDACLGE